MTSEANNATAYPAHIEELVSRYALALGDCQLDAVVIPAGEPQSIFMDDQQLPFKPNPYLLQWGPLDEHPGSALIYRRDAGAEWLVHRPEDFWHQVPDVPELIQGGPLRVTAVSSTDEIGARVAQLPPRKALLGPLGGAAANWDAGEPNPAGLVAAINEARTRKTSWEIDNLRQASAVGVAGHQAAEECFLQGGSEYDIHQAFRAACRTTDAEMPYPAIVACNSHAATLHYQRLERAAGSGVSLLIDAGAAHNGYASDITRTYSEGAEFGALIEAMHEVQRALCESAQPGVDYRELHRAAHYGIAGLLHDADLLTLDAASAARSGIIRYFFPHGLGHFLGLQVHDVGALYQRHVPPDDSPPGIDQHLRLTRVLEPGNVLTIEPGLYFIDSLLAELRATPLGEHVDWQRVDQLRPYGGIRIEDNIYVTERGNENLTRQAFADAEAGEHEAQQSAP